MEKAASTPCAEWQRLQAQLEQQRAQLEQQRLQIHAAKKHRRKIQALQTAGARLEKQPAAARKDSSTSSKPPSSDIVKPPPPPPPPGQDKRKQGGQPGHPKHDRALFPAEQVTHPFEHTLHACP